MTKLRYSLLLLAVMTAATAYAQNDPMLAQRVDSRKGYTTRIPAEAKLDSSASGWSPTEMFERRVYRIAGAGQIRITVTVKPVTAPDSAIDNGAYIYVDKDSATSGGTAPVRTYYLPTRSVRIEMIPESPRMLRYITARQTIFNAFRWKPGAASEAVNVP